MTDTLIIPVSGGLTLQGRHVSGTTIPVFELNGTDIVNGAPLPVFQLNGTDVVDGAPLPVFEVIGDLSVPAISSNSLLVTGATAIVSTSDNPYLVPLPGSLAINGQTPYIMPFVIPTTGQLSISGFAPSVANSGIIVKVPTAAALSISGGTPVLAQQAVIGIPAAASLSLVGANAKVAATVTIPLEPLEAFGVGVQGGIGSGVGLLNALIATGSGTPSVIGSGIAQFKFLIAYGTGQSSGVGVFKSMTASGQAATIGSGAATLQVLGTKNDVARVELQALSCYGFGDRVVTNTNIQTFVMNTRTSGVTKYAAFPYNSYAKIGDSYYGASSTGLYLLDGETDAGADIDWSFRTGQLDNKDPGLKRLPEVVLGLRSIGSIRVNAYYGGQSMTNTVPEVGAQSLHQHRVVLGKGARSRYFSVELEGIANSKIELDSLQVNMTKTTRRLG
jgi:hypothetical protein